MYLLPLLKMKFQTFYTFSLLLLHIIIFVVWQLALAIVWQLALAQMYMYAGP